MNDEREALTEKAGEVFRAQAPRASILPRSAVNARVRGLAGAGPCGAAPSCRTGVFIGRSSRIGLYLHERAGGCARAIVSRSWHPCRRKWLAVRLGCGRVQGAGGVAADLITRLARASSERRSPRSGPRGRARQQCGTAGTRQADGPGGERVIFVDGPEHADVQYLVEPRRSISAERSTPPNAPQAFREAGA